MVIKKGWCGVGFEEFKRGISSAFEKSGESGKISFRNNNGLFTAYCENGMRFLSKKGSYKITVRWGSGHQAQTTLASIMRV